MALLLTGDPVSFVNITIAIMHLTKAVSSRLTELTFVKVSILVLIFALAYLLVFIPVPIIVCLSYRAWKLRFCKFSFPVSLAIFEVPLVRAAAGLLVLSITSNHVSFKLALVHVLVTISEFTTTITLIFRPHTVVAVSILVVHHSLARPFVLIEVTDV